MRKDFGAKPYTYPQPVLMIATYGEDGKPDVMNAAWGGISDDKEISICVSENHKTTENILKKGAFTVSMADVEHMNQLICSLQENSPYLLPENFMENYFGMKKLLLFISMTIR